MIDGRVMVDNHPESELSVGFDKIFMSLTNKETHISLYLVIFFNQMNSERYLVR